MRKAVDLLEATPAGFWSPLIGGNQLYDHHWMQGSWGRGAVYLGHYLPTMVRVLLVKMEGYWK